MWKGGSAEQFVYRGWHDRFKKWKCVLFRSIQSILISPIPTLSCWESHYLFLVSYFPVSCDCEDSYLIIPWNGTMLLIHPVQSLNCSREDWPAMAKLMALPPGNNKIQTILVCFLLFVNFPPFFADIWRVWECRAWCGHYKQHSKIFEWCLVASGHNPSRVQICTMSSMLFSRRHRQQRLLSFFYFFRTFLCLKAYGIPFFIYKLIPQSVVYDWVGVSTCKEQSTIWPSPIQPLKPDIGFWKW